MLLSTKQIDREYLKENWPSLVLTEFSQRTNNGIFVDTQGTPPSWRDVHYVEYLWRQWRSWPLTDFSPCCWGWDKKQTVTLRRTNIILAFVWVLSGVAALFYILDYRITLWYGYNCDPSYLVASIFSHTKIFCTLVHHQAQVQVHLQLQSSKPNHWTFRDTEKRCIAHCGCS